MNDALRLLPISLGDLKPSQRVGIPLEDKYQISYWKKPMQRPRFGSLEVFQMIKHGNEFVGIYQISEGDDARAHRAEVRN